MNRRRTVMLTVGGMIGIITGARRARARFHSQEDGPIAGAGGTDVSGLGNAMPASAVKLRDLKAVGPEAQVTAVHHRSDTFEVTTADGRTTTFRQTNLQIKFDTSDRGPHVGRPVILPGGMRGDRVTVFFASPTEVATLIKSES